MDLESDTTTQDNPALASSETEGTPAGALDGVGDASITSPDGESNAVDVATLSHPELLQKHQDLLRGFTGKAEEAARQREKVEGLEANIHQMHTVMQDPDLVEGLLNKIRKSGGGSEDALSIEQVAEQAGFEPEFAVALNKYLDMNGYVRGTDPAVREMRDAMGILTQRTVDSEWSTVAKRYPGADSYQNKVYDLMRVAGSNLSMESALHAVSEGKLAAAQAQSAIKSDAESKAKAQLTQTTSNAPPRTPVHPSVNGRDYKKRPADAFEDAAQDLGIDLNKVFGRKTW